MSVELGYLLPTRERVMTGAHAARPMIDIARAAADLGIDSIWAGDSLLARPRHDPITLLSAVAGAVSDVTVGTAVLLPALRNPVVLAQQLATLDQISEGRLVVGCGIAADTPPIRAEFRAAGVPFERRLGEFMEGLRLARALWQGEPVDWDGRWHLSQAVLGPKPYRPGGPPVWIAAGVDAGIARAARHFDGWFPIGPDVATFAERNRAYQAQCVQKPCTAMYLTVCVDDDAARGDARINAYLEDYYSVPAAAMRRFQACCGGPLDVVLQFLRSYADAGAAHLVLRLVGDDPVAALSAIAAERGTLG